MFIKKMFMLIVLSWSLISCNKNEADVMNMNFEELEKLSRSSVVTFYMWGGSEKVNSWIDTYVGGKLKAQYDITLKRVPMDASVFVNKLLTEKSANKIVGEIDLLWINGENFKNARMGKVLFGPYLEKLPNYNNFIEPSSAKTDSGFPVDGYEVPYGKAQFNYIYDSDVVQNPPLNFNELLKWVKINPGLFTYPQPPDFTGSAFVRQAFYALTGGYKQYLDGFNKELFDKNSKLLWDYLNEMEPYLWQEGKNYPKEKSNMDKLFEKGEIGFSMTFTQTEAQSKINDGIYPDSVRSLVFKDGSLSNTHFTAIPFNSPNKAGAMVVSNFLISPEIQASKNNPDNWGDFTVLSIKKLNKSDKDRFYSLNLGEATLPLETLDKYAVPEIPSEYLEALEEGWDINVLKK